MAGLLGGGGRLEPRAVPKREVGGHEAPGTPDTPGDSGGGKNIGISLAEAPGS